MKDLKTIESRVRAILANNEEARDDDMILYLLYCNRYGEVRVGELPFELKRLLRNRLKKLAIRRLRLPRKPQSIR